MVLVEKVLGNAGDPEWAQRLADVSVEPLSLDHWEAQKNRFRKKTAGGVELAVSLDRGTFMRDGDVLFWDAAATRAIGGLGGDPATKALLLEIPNALLSRSQ